jgi:hypothetical protein
VCRSIEPRTEKKRKITNKIFSSVSFLKVLGLINMFAKISFFFFVLFCVVGKFI